MSITPSQVQEEEGGVRGGQGTAEEAEVEGEEVAVSDPMKTLSWMPPTQRRPGGDLRAG